MQGYPNCRSPPCMHAATNAASSWYSNTPGRQLAQIASWAAADTRFASNKQAIWPQVWGGKGRGGAQGFGKELRRV